MPDPQRPKVSAELSAALAVWTSEEGRRWPSWEAAKEALLPWYGGDDARVGSWQGKRVRALPDGSWCAAPVRQRLRRDPQRGVRVEREGPPESRSRALRLRCGRAHTAETRRGRETPSEPPSAAAPPRQGGDAERASLRAPGGLT